MYLRKLIVVHALCVKALNSFAHASPPNTGMLLDFIHSSNPGRHTFVVVPDKDNKRHFGGVLSVSRVEKGNRTFGRGKEYSGDEQYTWEIPLMFEVEKETSSERLPETDEKELPCAYCTRPTLTAFLRVADHGVNKWSFQRNTHFIVLQLRWRVMQTKKQPYDLVACLQCVDELWEEHRRTIRLEHGAQQDEKGWMDSITLMCVYNPENCEPFEHSLCFY